MNNLGKTCYVNVIKLYQGLEPFDFPRFKIVGEKKEHYLITDTGSRFFLVDKKFINILE